MKVRPRSADLGRPPVPCQYVPPSAQREADEGAQNWVQDGSDDLPGQKYDRQQEEQSVLGEEDASALCGLWIQQIQQDMRSIQRRNREQVEQHQHHVQLHALPEDELEHVDP